MKGLTKEFVLSLLVNSPYCGETQYISNKILYAKTPLSRCANNSTVKSKITNINLLGAGIDFRDQNPKSVAECDV